MRPLLPGEYYAVYLVHAKHGKEQISDKLYSLDEAEELMHMQPLYISELDGYHYEIWITEDQDHYEFEDDDGACRHSTRLHRLLLVSKLERDPRLVNASFLNSLLSSARAITQDESLTLTGEL